jgi:hypothetical protein
MDCWKKYYLFGPWIAANVYTAKWGWFLIRSSLTRATYGKREGTPKLNKA